MGQGASSEKRPRPVSIAHRGDARLARSSKAFQHSPAVQRTSWAASAVDADTLRREHEESLERARKLAYELNNDVRAASSG